MSQCLRSHICASKRQLEVDLNVDHWALSNVPSKGLWKIMRSGPAFLGGLRTGGAIVEVQRFALVCLMERQIF